MNGTAKWSVAIGLACVLVLAGIRTYAQVISKNCSKCGSPVSLDSRPGMRCPSCGALWGSEQTSTRGGQPSGESGGDALREARDQREWEKFKEDYERRRREYMSQYPLGRWLLNFLIAGFALCIGTAAVTLVFSATPPGQLFLARLSLYLDNRGKARDRLNRLMAKRPGSVSAQRAQELYEKHFPPKPRGDAGNE